MFSGMFLNRQSISSLTSSNFKKIDIFFLMQFRKNDSKSEDDVPYGYGFFHIVFATGAMYFAMLLIGWNTHHPMKKYASPLADV